MSLAESISIVVVFIAAIVSTFFDPSSGGPVPNGNSDVPSPCFLNDGTGNLEYRTLADTVAHISREVEGVRIEISMAKQMVKSLDFKNVSYFEKKKKKLCICDSIS